MAANNENDIVDLDSLPDGALISARQLEALAQRSRVSMWRDVRDGRLADAGAAGPELDPLDRRRCATVSHRSDLKTNCKPVRTGR